MNIEGFVVCVLLVGGNIYLFYTDKSGKLMPENLVCFLAEMVAFS